MLLLRTGDNCTTAFKIENILDMSEKINKSNVLQLEKRNRKHWSRMGNMQLGSSANEKVC